MPFSSIGPVRDRQDHRVEVDELPLVHEVDAILLPRLHRVGERVVNYRKTAVVGEFGHDVGNAAVAEVRHVLLEGKAAHGHTGAADVTPRAGKQLDRSPGDVPPHLVVDATAGKDDVGPIADRLGLGGEVVGGRRRCNARRPARG